MARIPSRADIEQRGGIGSIDTTEQNINEELYGFHKSRSKEAESEVRSSEIVANVCHLAEGLKIHPDRACSCLKPVIDFVCYPGFVRFVVNVTETHRKNYIRFKPRWNTFEEYNQQASQLQVEVRPQRLDEVEHAEANPIVTVTLRTPRRAFRSAKSALWIPWLCAFLSTSSFLIDISALDARASVTLTILLTVVTLDVYEPVKNVPTVEKFLMNTQNFIFIVFIKDMLFAMVYQVIVFLSEKGSFDNTWGYYLDFFSDGPAADDDTEDYLFTVAHRIFKIEAVIFVLLWLYWLYYGRLIIMTWFVEEGNSEASTSVIAQNMKTLGSLVEGGDARGFLSERASAFMHFIWRKGYNRQQLKAEPGKKVKPRWKHNETTKGPPKDLITPDKGMVWNDYTNINQIYANLPENLKNLNRDSILDAFDDIDNHPFADRNELASLTHVSWVNRNSWCDESLKAPFDKLPLYQQDKDIVVVNIICAFAAEFTFNMHEIMDLDGDANMMIDPLEFFYQDRLKRFFHHNYRIPFRRGDIVKFVDPEKSGRHKLTGTILYYKKNMKELVDKRDEIFVPCTMYYIQDAQFKTWSIPEKYIQLSMIPVEYILEMMMLRSECHFRDDGLSSTQDYDEICSTKVDNLIEAQSEEFISASSSSSNPPPRVRKKKVSAPKKKKFKSVFRPHIH